MFAVPSDDPAFALRASCHGLAVSKTLVLEPDPLENLHAADLADRLQRLSTAEACALLEGLPPDRAASTLIELEPDRVPELVAGWEPRRLGDLLSRVPPPEAVDVLQQLRPGLRRDILAALPTDHAAGLRALMRYPEDSAGGIMSNRFIALHEDMTVAEAREALHARNEAGGPDEVAYLYVTDAAQRLVGVVSLRDLVFGRADRRLSELMNREAKHLRVETDQEELARQFEHYHYLGLPVLDAEGKLVGVVKASDALAVARREATEDMQLMVGLSGEERALTPWRKSVGRRLPWLGLNLITAFAAATVVSQFENTIDQWTALAVFLPIIAGQGGNAGMQTLTVMIRDLALGELSPGEGHLALIKELAVGLVNGLVIGLIVGVIGYVWKGSLLLGIVAGAATLFNQIAAALAGVLIPLSLRMLRVDPALASSIFLTTVTDVAGFFFFLGMAALALRFAAP